MAKYRQDEIQKRVEAAMEQVGKEKFQPNPFLLTRIQARLEEPEPAPALTFRGAFRFAIVAVLLVLNSWVAWQYLEGNDASGPDETAVVLQYGWEETAATDYLLMPELNENSNEN
jgi:hypothetical protein